MVGKHEIDQLLKLGSTETLPDGNVGIRLTAQYRGRPVSDDRKEWKAQMRTWQKALASDLAKLGGNIVEDSLSISGQSVELVVPLGEIDEAVRRLESQGMVVKLQRERTVDPEY